jgi:hypothetical protein
MFNAPKGQKDSAQGFNPGYRGVVECALKVAPGCVRAWLDLPIRRDEPILVPLQGTSP